MEKITVYEVKCTAKLVDAEKSSQGVCVEFRKLSDNLDNWKRQVIEVDTEPEAYTIARFKSAEISNGNLAICFLVPIYENALTDIMNGSKSIMSAICRKLCLDDKSAVKDNILKSIETKVAIPFKKH